MKKEKIAFYCGSFDPFHIGHESIVNMALDLFDKVIICIAYNDSKKGFIPVNIRKNIIERIFKNNPRIKVIISYGLVADIANQENATVIIKGVRDSNDFSNEMNQADCNMFIGNIPTIFIPSNPKYSYVSSTLIRTILKMTYLSNEDPKERNYQLLKSILNKEFIDYYYNNS